MEGGSSGETRPGERMRRARADLGGLGEEEGLGEGELGDLAEMTVVLGMAAAGRRSGVCGPEKEQQRPWRRRDGLSRRVAEGGMVGCWLESKTEGGDRFNLLTALFCLLVLYIYISTWEIEINTSVSCLFGTTYLVMLGRREEKKRRLGKTGEMSDIS